MANLARIAWNRFPARPDPQDLVSRNFRFHELTRSEIALRQRIDNRFESVRHLRAAVHLCRKVLQPLRERFGSFSPNSVYRSQALERALKGKPARWVSSSQHAVGEACDVEIPGVSTLELARWAAANLQFDQIICECFDPAKGANSGWVHISLRAPGAGANRAKLLSYVWDRRAAQYVYVPGLAASA